MTKEEAIILLRANVMVACDTSDKVGYGTPLNKAIEQALKMAIKTLEQEPCEDCWSKKEVVDIINRQRFGINKISMGIIKEKLEALPSVTPTHTETVTEFADRCIECGNTYGKQLKQLERIKERYNEERGMLLNSSSEYTPNNVLDIIDYIIHGD